MANEIKVTLARQQIVNGKHYAAGEHTVSDDVAAQLKRRHEKRGDVLDEGKAAKSDAAKADSAKSAEPAKNEPAK